MNRIDPNKDSRTYIFDYLFRCKVPYLESCSPDYIKHFGMHTTGNDAIDKTLANQLIDTYCTIAQMVEYFDKGVRIYIPVPDDLKFMYDCITHHLSLWKHQLQHGINIGDAPVEDLIKLDAFANSVYAHAKYQFTPEIAQSLLVRHMSSISLNKTSFFRNKPVEPEEQKRDQSGRVIAQPVDDRFPQRESMAEVFKGRKFGTRFGAGS